MNSSKAAMKGKKICIGDTITVQKENKEKKGTVKYIGYPFAGHAVRYGIKLEKARGANDGSLLMDIKTTAVYKRIPKHMPSSRKKYIKKRKFFEAGKDRGLFVKKEFISSISRQAQGESRLTVDDLVNVKFRGEGCVKFVGVLEHTSAMGIWYGVELNDRRGRHDGTVNGVKYFDCKPQYGLHCRKSHLTLAVEPKPNGLRKTPTIDVIPPEKQKGFEFAISPSARSQNDDSSTTQGTFFPSKGSSTDNNGKLGIKLPKAVSVDVRSGFHVPQDSWAMKRKGLVSGGGTMAVLPGYQELKTRKFLQHYDFDEFDDELGDGEFGVVYRCKKIKIKDDDSDGDGDEIEDSFFSRGDTCREFEPYDDTSTGTRKSVSNSLSGSGGPLYPGDTVGGFENNSDDDDDDEIFAVKKIKKAKFHHLNHTHKTETIVLLQDEIRVLEAIHQLKQTNTPGSEYLVKLIDVFEDRNYLYIVTNFCNGGNLWAHVDNASNVGKHDNDDETKCDNEYIINSEAEIQKIMKQILLGLSFLHKQNLAHLDLKPDNIMFVTDEESGELIVQLIDFGMSRMIPPLHKAKALVGTPNFVAPEVIRGFYDTKADVWSAGVIFFMLRFGYPPFFDQGAMNAIVSTMDNKIDGAFEANKRLFDAIQKGFCPEVKDGLGAWFPAGTAASEELKDLIAKMLDSDLSKRFTVDECLGHKYFQKIANKELLPKTVMNAMEKFSGFNRFRVLISRLFAHQIEPDQQRQLKDVWKQFDTDGSETLNLEQFKKAMKKFKHGYKDSDIEAIFEALDWKETDTINFNSLLTAYSYQRLVAVDERLWEAFAKLDDDGDGRITKEEIKKVVALVSPDEYKEGIEKILPKMPVKNARKKPLPGVNKTLSVSSDTPKGHNPGQLTMFINDCLISADWDDDGCIDYEEFLRALHPRFNEPTVADAGVIITKDTGTHFPADMVNVTTQATGYDEYKTNAD